MPVQRVHGDRPEADAPPAPSPSAPPSPAAAPPHNAPPLAPASGSSPEHSPWWSAPSGKPFGIPDFAHEFAARLAWLLPQPQLVPVPLPVRARRR